ncbi:zinc transporter [Rhodobium orientis]|uniref:Zinc transporter ZntB n=1 Tax=Rhodobium orientis TaxID=34017 RepID=A0A327JSH0_9HYPH|nr:zinc transporter ZntB [Rhodobium orientis]MBB4302310.1 zinc transporter [Rhodobium orientis]MBK5949019.1 zinc transporter ZntB [Rhodobium orientis]RAI29011.1 zinc transporter ZntB [Rhodobium orientis]
MTLVDESPETPPRFLDVVSFVFDGKGGAREIAADDFAKTSFATGESGFAWLHLKREASATPALLAALDLDGYVTDALTAEETRPRCTVHGDGVLINLRGVNLHPSADPEDMISVRLWATERQVIGVSVRPLFAIGDLLAAISRGQAPVSAGDFVAKLALRLADRAEPAVADLTDAIDDLEDLSLDPEAFVSRHDLSAIRRAAILLRRYLVPQRDALSTLEIEDLPFLGERDRAHLREAADRVLRLGEELDAIRDRAQVVHDQILDQRAESLNRRMLLLSIVAAIFLPLGLVTSLLGINVGGIPGANNPDAFAIVCALLAALGAGSYWWIRRTGMFR